MAKGWDKESLRHSMAKKLGKAPPYRNNPKKKVTIKERKSEFGLPLKLVREIEEKTDSKISNVREDKNWGVDSHTIEMKDGSEYVMFDKDDDAQYYAEGMVRDDLEENPEMFSQDWLQGHLYVSDTDKGIIANEEADFRLTDMSDAEIKEQAGIEDIDKAREKLETKIYDEWYNGLDEDPIGFLVEEQGLFSREDALKQNYIRINVDEASKDAVSTDGWQHFVATYDGDSIELKEGEVLARTN